MSAQTVDTLTRPAPDEQAKWSSLALSALVHLLLIGALFVGMQWKSKPPSSVEVEVWRAPPAPVAAPRPEKAGDERPEPRQPPQPAVRPEPRPKPEPKPEPQPEVKPEAKPEPRAAAKVPAKPEARAPVRPDIALKNERKPKELPKKEEDKPKETSRKEPAKAKEQPPKEEARAKASTKKDEAKPREPERKDDQRVREQARKEEVKKLQPERGPNFGEALEREQKELQQQKAAQKAVADQRARAEAEARQMRQLEAEQKASENKRALEEYRNRVRGKIRGNISLPPGIQGNPEAIFEVTQLPTGEVLEVKVRRSSGNPALDTAVERAIRKSSPLPKPAQPELFERVLRIPYRPRDE
ncbi:cell envelope integrity protein TolA [Accumulibacter sp.]|uniref:cell envelope integrity protein TolA n=1 Tax=Accumulibacter sp. TaxID=2053492 RepID=UPI00260228CA|nr:cell envelope integrity protein TolA [Accumulibacter sp.]